MKKLTNDPSRNVNAVSGMWVRLRKDGSKYDVRYVNARVRRVWSLSQTSQGTAWNVQAKGVQYEDFLNGMRSSSVDLEHGWMLIPDSERMKTVPVPVPTGMDAKTVGGIVAHPSIDANWKCEEERFTSNVQWPVPMPEDAILEDEFMDDEPAPDTQEIPEVPPKVNSFAVSYCTMPDLMMAKECPELQGLGPIRHFRTSKGRKVAYVASANGRCVVAYRARYERGSDRKRRWPITWLPSATSGLRRRDMSEIREKAVRLLLQAAYEMAADNADSVADIFDCQHGFIDDLRRRAMLKLDKPYTAPDFDTAEQQIAETGLSLDMLDKRAREAFSQKYSTTYDRYECAIGWCIDDMLGWE